MLCCDWLRLISTPKILAIVLEFLLGKDKRVQELCKLRSYEFYKGIRHHLDRQFKYFSLKMPRYEHSHCLPFGDMSLGGIGSMASSSRGETECTEHGPSTLTGIDHEDEDDLLKDLPEIKEFYRLPGICKNAKSTKGKTVLNISKIRQLKYFQLLLYFTNETSFMDICCSRICL